MARSCSLVSRIDISVLGGSSRKSGHNQITYGPIDVVVVRSQREDIWISVFINRNSLFIKPRKPSRQRS